jgi:acyl carrier protein
MQKLNQILIETLKISPEDVTLNLGMDDVRNWDSLTHMTLIVTIENDFGIELSGDDIAEMITFDKIREIVKKYTADEVV